MWARDTAYIKRELHLAQCRAARRIFVAEQDGPRCLGAFQVYRQQRLNEAVRARRQREREGQPLWQQQHERSAEDEAARQRGELPGDLRRRSSMEELIPHCNAVGRFQRLGGGGKEDSHADAAFVCNFCNGFIVWPDLKSVPSARTALPAPATTAMTDPSKNNTPSSSASLSSSENSKTINNGYPHWQAPGASAQTGEEKIIVFPPLAIANHMAPEPGDWQAGLICPYCEEDTYLDQGEDSSEVKYVQDETGFPDLEAFREHLEWYHTALAVPAVSALTSALPTAVTESCRIM